MAFRGRKPTATVIRLVTGNPQKAPIPQGEPTPDGRPELPPKLKGRALALWHQFIVPSFWLTSADGFKAYMWCALAAEFERSPAKMIAGRIAQLRALGSELGLDPASRTRLGGDGKQKKPDPADQFFA